jgi:replicative DNA helicase
MILSNPSAERAVLSSICRYGSEIFFDLADILTDTCFTIDSNSIIFQCIKKSIETDSKNKIDIASIYSSAQSLGLSGIFNKKEENQHLKAIIDFPVDKENARSFAIQIRKLDIVRSLRQELQKTQDKLLNITGTENISSILSTAEESVLNFSTSLTDTDNHPIPIGHALDEYLDHLVTNPVSQIGIPTGFPVYDGAIGGGLRKGTINVIAARPKTGKTLLSDNMGFFIASELQIPVLNLDTEMNKEDHVNRILAMISETEINQIETGTFSQSPMIKAKIEQAAEKVKNSKLYYKSIAGKSFDEQLSLMRRWVMTEVGTNPDGTAKDCVIFYDYLKLMDSQGISQDMKEYQLLGFMMTSLHNFAVKYKLPIVAFIQLNRDGITKESTDTASGSDRIIWLCSNFSIFKRKTDEEIAEDGPDNGNRKLIPVISRHGSGLEDNNYINCHMKGWCAKITEGKTRLEVINNIGGKTDGFVIGEDDANQEVFSFN